MNERKSTPGERKLVVALFILVLITFSLAQRDSKRLDRLYTLLFDKKTNTALTQKPEPALVPLK